MSAVVAATAWAVALLLLGRPHPPRPRVARPGGGAQSSRVARVLLCLGAGAVAGLALAGPRPAALVWTVVVALGCGWVLRRGPALVAQRADRQVARDLPHLVLLLGAGLRAGASPTAALTAACEASPGPVAERLRPVTSRLAWGTDPAEVWDELARDPVLGPLGRRLARSHRTGAAVSDAVAELARDLAARRRTEVEDLARTVGVRAALPLGLCLLPAFLLLGIVPVVAGLVSSLSWG
ncbi:type II secretion system F family protein [Nocardioides jishulii]|uniref:type II secretion system F family protein n=1 Tax=Nocardioides jishulii TaxID=2575440 RepID=UPI0014850454|nr:type II secretion system F family protein [Nocardioides jishulii]